MPEDLGVAEVLAPVVGDDRVAGEAPPAPPPVGGVGQGLGLTAFGGGVDGDQAAAGDQAGGVGSVDDAAAGHGQALRVMLQGRPLSLPVHHVRADRVAPGAVLLVEEVVLALVEDQAVGVGEVPRGGAVVVGGAVGGRGRRVGGRGRRRAPTPRGAAHQDGSAHDEGAGAGRAEDEGSTPQAGSVRLRILGVGRLRRRRHRRRVRGGRRTRLRLSRPRFRGARGACRLSRMGGVVRIRGMGAVGLVRHGLKVIGRSGERRRPLERALRGLDHVGQQQGAGHGAHAAGVG